MIVQGRWERSVLKWFLPDQPPGLVCLKKRPRSDTFTVLPLVASAEPLKKLNHEPRVTIMQTTHCRVRWRECLDWREGEIITTDRA